MKCCDAPFKTYFLRRVMGLWCQHFHSYKGGASSPRKVEDTQIQYQTACIDGASSKRNPSDNVWGSSGSHELPRPFQNLHFYHLNFISTLFMHTIFKTVSITSYEVPLVFL
jgi:hypothetical protein